MCLSFCVVYPSTCLCAYVYLAIHRYFFTAYDCPLFKGIYDYCSVMAGASITAASCLLQRNATVAINWYGGWHHAGK